MASDREPHIIASKFANAFVPGAAMSAGARRALIFGGASTFDRLRTRMGGLWVGGSVVLTTDAIRFAPNAMNAAAHESETAQSIALADVVEVTGRFGWVTRIVDVRARDGTLLTFRCFGAPAFSARIREAATAARNGRR
jgi:hypothetical protein